MAGIEYVDEKKISSGIEYAEEDKYQKEARERLDRLKKAGAGPSYFSDLTRRLTQGVGMNWTDEVLAGATAPIEAVRHGVLDPKGLAVQAIPSRIRSIAGIEDTPSGLEEGYKYGKAREDLILERARQNTGLTGSAVELLGGLATGGRAVVGGLPQAASAAIRQAPGVWNTIGRYAGNVGKGAVVGGAGGAGEGNTLGERAVGTGVGTVLGGVLAGTLPIAFQGIRHVAQPLTNQFRRFAGSSPTAPISNVDDIATAAIADTIQRSGKKGTGPGMAGHVEPARIDPATGAPVAARFVTNLEREVADANAAGQPYILADAIGLEGQRRLGGVAKQPGPARQWIDEDLTLRDSSRGLRASGAVAEGMGVPRGMTADMASDWLQREARRRSTPHYEEAYAIQPTWSERMGDFFRYPDFQKALREGYKLERGRALANNQPFNPHDYAITHFDEAGDPIMSAVPNMRTIQLMKEGIDALIYKPENLHPITGRLDTTNRQVQNLNNLQRAFLREVDSLNPAYARARAEYAGPASARRAIETGQDLPSGGQPIDTIRNMERLSEQQRQGVRIGVADRAATDISKATETGPLPAYLRNQKGREELEYLSLHQGPRQEVPPNVLARRSDPQRFQPDPLRRAIQREQVMRDTLVQARRGPQTAENLADMADTLPPPPDVTGIIGNLMSGRFLAAAKELMPAVSRGAKGETEAQRTAMARILMERDPAELAAIMQRMNALYARREAAATARAGAAAGGAGSTGQTRRQQQRLIGR